MYKGNAPCACCGTPGSERPRQRKDVICYDCRKLVRLGKQAKERIDQGERLEEHVSATWYVFEKIYNKDGQWKQAKEFSRLLLNMLEALAIRTDKAGYRADRFHIESTGASRSTHWSFREGQAEPVYDFLHQYLSTMRELDEMQQELDRRESLIDQQAKEKLAELKNEIFAKGVEEGRNLLLQLNAGHITMNQFLETDKPYKPE